MFTQEQSDELDRAYFNKIENVTLREARKNMLAEAYILYEEDGEINDSKLAENVANSMELYQDDDSAAIPECLFDMAFNISELVTSELEENHD